jgi:GWxTD domain-containing protein
VKPMRPRKKKQERFGLGLLFLLLAFSSSCRLYNLKKELPANYADFLSKVRYIITGREEKAFLKLPDSEKDQFIEEFWKRRDPDPETEENEFKKEYFGRIDRADRLFLGEGRPGWLTDRGRIYILFGPPFNRITNPLEGEFGVRCGEVWYYGNFPVVFRDPNCMGSYELVTYDLTPLREVNIAYMHDLSQAQAQAQAQAQETFSRENDFFDFRFEVGKKTVEPERITGVVIIAIPYACIWFKDTEGLFKTEMEVQLELRDETGQLRWEDKANFEIALSLAELKERQKASYNCEIPFVLEKSLEELRRGKNTLQCRVKNLTGHEELRKVLEVNF